MGDRLGLDEFRRTLLRRWHGLEILVPVLFAAGADLALVLPSDASGYYYHYAKEALQSPLFHTLPPEYPAASLAAFLPPLLLPLPYKVAFAVFAAVATIALLLSSDGLQAHPGWGRRTATYLLVGAAALVFSRYDIFAALTSFLAVEAARRHSWGRAWAWAIAGGLLKLFPFALLPGFFLSEHARTRRWPLRRAALACLPIGALALAQAALAPGSLLSPLRFELKRGFDVESVDATVSLLTDPLHVKWGFAFGSHELVGPYHDLIAVLVTLAMLCGLATIWWLAAKDRLSVEATSVAVLTVAVLGDKAFSPQYLIWLAPLWAYWPLRWGWLGVGALTTLAFPVLYMEAQQFGPGYYLPAIVSAFRNVLFIVVLVRWLCDQLRADQADLSNLFPARAPSTTAGLSRP